MLKDVIHRAGWVVHRFDPHAYTSFQTLQSLEHARVDLVFDIGANIGQFAKELRWIGYKGEIVSFEPLSAAHGTLLEAARRDPLWHIHPRIAIGNFDGEIEINIAGNSVSSSVLPMLDSHSSAEEGSAYEGSERVPVARLDSVAPAYIGPDNRFFLKVDAQGFEWEVLNGAAETLKNARGLLCELSLLPLYEGQHHWREMIDRLEGEGFTLWAIQKGFTDKKSGRSMQVDIIFLRLEDEKS